MSLPKDESRSDAPEYASVKPLKADFDQFAASADQIRANKLELFAAQQIVWDEVPAKAKLAALRAVRERGIEIARRKCPHKLKERPWQH